MKKSYKNFYHLLSAESGITDTKAVKMIYHGLCRLIERQLRQVGEIELPEIGRLQIKQHAEHKLKNRIIPPSKRIAYIPHRGFKERMKQ